MPKIGSVFFLCVFFYLNATEIASGYLLQPCLLVIDDFLSFIRCRHSLEKVLQYVHSTSEYQLSDPHTEVVRNRKASGALKQECGGNSYKAWWPVLRSNAVKSKYIFFFQVSCAVPVIYDIILHSVF